METSGVKTDSEECTDWDFRFLGERLLQKGVTSLESSSFPTARRLRLPLTSQADHDHALNPCPLVSVVSVCLSFNLFPCL